MSLLPVPRPAANGSIAACFAGETNVSIPILIDPALIKKILPIVAALALGVLSQKSKTGSIPPGIPGDARDETGGGLGGILSSVLDSDKVKKALEEAAKDGHAFL